MSKFADDWAKAKADFQSATKAKKPTPTFMGLFEKGPGITAALKKADAAKHIGELKAAMKTFQAAAKDYTKTLEKAIANPKITPTTDQAVYAAAVKKLKEDLDFLYESAERMKPTFKSNVNKNSVHPEFLKGIVEKPRLEAAAQKKAQEELAAAQKEGEKLIAIYEGLADSLKQTLTKYKGQKVEAAAANALKQFDAAKTAKKKGDTMQADVSASASLKFAADAAESLATLEQAWENECKKLEKQFTPEALNTKAPTNLPKDEAATFLNDFRKEWRAAEKCRTAVKDYLTQLSTTVAEAAAAAESAEVYRIAKSGPATYLKRIAEIQGRIDTLRVPIEKRDKSQSGSVDKVLDIIREDHRRNLEKGIRGKGNMIIDAHKNAVAETGVYIKELKALERRLKAVPNEALDDTAVEKAHTDAEKALTGLQDTANRSFAHDAKFIKDAESIISSDK